MTGHLAFLVVFLCRFQHLNTPPLPSRFHGNDQCVCGDVSVTERYSQVQWDAFAVEVLDTLYNTAPISMHCNQSTARLFPVSAPVSHTHVHTHSHTVMNSQASN